MTKPEISIETPRSNNLAHKLWGTWPKVGEVEAFDLARTLERELIILRAEVENLRVFKRSVSRYRLSAPVRRRRKKQ